MYMTLSQIKTIKKYENKLYTGALKEKRRTDMKIFLKKTIIQNMELSHKAICAYIALCSICNITKETEYITAEALCYAVLLSIQHEARKILSSADVEELKKTSCNGRRLENIEKQIGFAEERKEKINKFKQKTYQSYMEELISKDDYIQYSSKYADDIAELDSEILELEKQKDNEKELEQEYREWIDKFSEYVDIDELTRGIVLELIERIDVSEDGNICIHYRFRNPYEE